MGHTDTRGLLTLQIHFSEDFQDVFMSVVLQYNSPHSVHSGEMPSEVSQRHQKLLQHIENVSTKAQIDSSPFRHWNYKNQTLWAKPLISFGHRIDSLSDSRVLLRELELLANILNGAFAINLNIRRI